MKSSGVRWLLYAAVAVMALLHHDVWYWNDPTLVLGLPVGLTYHIAFCVAASALMALLVRFAWPAGLEGDDDGEGR